MVPAIDHPPTTGLDEVSPPSPSFKDEVTVLVTGFAPFKSTHPTNPSYSIASSLPTYLSRLPSTPNAPRINLVIHHPPVRVSYTFVRALIPSLYASHPKIDFVLHIGMAAGRSFYTMETRAHRDGYTLRDVDGKEDEEGSEIEDDGKKKEGVWEREGCPAILETGFESEDVWRRWKNELPDIDIRPSTDAGHYLCDFIYYASLAYFYKRAAGAIGEEKGGETPVMFLHVPGEAEKEDIERGREVAIGLIRGMVGSWMKGKERYKEVATEL
ncbi:MAG: hypothetical protein M1812_002760 [Candelaria pacifica]|nr:MAG: hypothetical protein M1812_002760 [Candelaria pacifica]